MFYVLCSMFYVLCSKKYSKKYGKKRNTEKRNTGHSQTENTVHSQNKFRKINLNDRCALKITTFKNNRRLQGNRLQ